MSTTSDLGGIAGSSRPSSQDMASQMALALEEAGRAMGLNEQKAKSLAFSETSANMRMQAGFAFKLRTLSMQEAAKKEERIKQAKEESRKLQEQFEEQRRQAEEQHRKAIQLYERKRKDEQEDKSREIRRRALEREVHILIIVVFGLLSIYFCTCIFPLVSHYFFYDSREREWQPATPKNSTNCSGCVTWTPSSRCLFQSIALPCR